MKCLVSVVVILSFIGYAQTVCATTMEEEVIVIDEKFWKKKVAELPEYGDGAAWSDVYEFEEGGGNARMKPPEGNSLDLPQMSLPNGLAQLIKWLMIGLGVFALCYLIYHLVVEAPIKNPTVNVKTIKSIEEDLENTPVSELERLLQQAIAEGNYRIAIRILYLQTLKLFADKQLIQWHKDKTNQAYLLEMSETPVYRDFASFTRKFEESWYGLLLVDSEAFGKIQRVQQKIHDQILNNES